jgi:outer membrane murein-binding lipoprotein Lpp
MIPPKITKSGGIMWSFSNVSLETASRWWDIANVALLASLLAGAVATFVLVRTGSIKELHWDRERDAAREHIAELVKESARLSAEAEAARAEIAAAQQVAAQARLEQERLRVRPETMHWNCLAFSASTGWMPA